mmetsp:Transcript_107938/g.196492  ORF Transcript_107938/g.196492 Transcript_107938/m.196492 type:complete len:490 (-) Transcript_107938:96-1565(-)
MYGWEKTLGRCSVLEHVCIRFLQICLHYILPYVMISRLWMATIGPFPWTFALLVEIAFHIWMAQSVLPKLHATPAEIEPCHEPIEDKWMSSVEAISAVAKLGYPLEKFLSGWFLGAEMKRISYDKLLAWCSWMLCGKDPSVLKPDCRKTLTRIVDQMCSRLGLNLAASDDPDVEFISLFGEPLLFLQRSFLMYAISSALPRLVASLVFQTVLGLKREHCEETGMYYWWRAPCPEHVDFVDAPPDLLFFHGLCGLTGYIPLITGILLKSPSQGAVLFEIEDVSQSLNFSRRLSMDAVQKTARCATNRLQEARGGPQRSCIVVGHSLGSCAVAQLAEQPPAPLAGVVLIDPVAILLMLPDVAHGFLHRMPQTVFDWFCFLWCASEPGIANFFRRRFFWYNSCVDLPSLRHVPTLLCLSGSDRLVPSETVRAYAEQVLPEADILWWEKMDHTCFMTSARCHMQVLQWIEKCCKGKEGKVKPPAAVLEPYMAG